VIRVNMPKARDIWRDKIRAARAPRLAELDAQFLRAVEAGDTVRQAEIVAAKQALRDAPADPRIDAAQTPDALQQVKPF